MASYNQNGWLDTAMDQVRCRPEHQAIRAELLGHIEDKEQYFLDQGMEPAQAGRAAVEAMGDPTEVGKALDQAHPFIWGKLYTLAKGVIVLLCIVVFFFALDGVSAGEWKDWLDRHPWKFEITDPAALEGNVVILEDTALPILQSGYSIDVTQAYWREGTLNLDIKVSNPRPWAAAPLFMRRLQVEGDADTTLEETDSRMPDGSIVSGPMTQWYSVLSQLRYWNAWYFTVRLSNVDPGEEVKLYLPGNSEVQWTFRVEVGQ